ncbi:hypothetical protein [Neotamlana laminarinivorans]|uniref:Uncharacterized protein n=1 Tax=Neotamlana laminarinivorans TaxID=2883124 RepID=A0A9X1L598_9FLAO|nr:hypothetical protein [Tamlana laminarinivorans]MCB4800187.1 hypothetical protein [Tamlana laminarinivorans]
MATITNLQLDIKKGSSSSDVTVSYELCFSHCERLDETVFVETITLRGDDPISDDHLTTISNTCVKATKACIKRKFTRKVNNSVLNEDPKILWVKQSDEVYARVALLPFNPSSTSSNSNIVNSYFD